MFFYFCCSGSCRFGAAVLPPVRVFLVVAVWAPSALVLLGCYIYVYLVARSHARAIYTVELSFRHQTQTLALPRYGQTLAVTVGAFLVLWLPFQVMTSGMVILLMLHDYESTCMYAHSHGIHVSSTIVVMKEIVFEKVQGQTLVKHRQENFYVRFHQDWFNWLLDNRDLNLNHC